MSPSSKFRWWVATAFLLVTFAAASGAGVDDRSAFLLERLRAVPLPLPGGAGKLPYGNALAHLAATGGQDEAARAYLAGTGYGGELWFNAIMQVRGLYLARAHLTPDQLAAIRATATDPAHNWGNFGTENHRKMTWSSGYLLAQAFPDAQWRWGNESISSGELMRRTKELLASVGRNEFRAGYSECLSPNYLVYHLTPMVNLYDYAEDPEMRAIAQASLLYHFSILALGSFQEVLLPPWSRYAGDMNLSITGAHSQWLLWLFWGHGVVEPTRTIDPTSPVMFFAVSDWRPPEILDWISARGFTQPWTARMQQPHFQWNPDRYVMRTTYHEPGYAVSSGVVRHLPTAFQLDDAQFGIAWAGGAPIRQITAFHPYWRSVTGGENDWRAPTSPFMQTAHHENTAIMLFDIPATDPWAGFGQWAAERSGPMIPLGQVRYPSHMSYTAGADNWIFLRDGTVFVAVKILKPGWVRDRRALESQGFHVIKSRGVDGQPWQTGFIFEVGTEQEFGSLAAFQAAVQGNPVSVDWDNLTVSYTNTRGDTLAIAFNRALQTNPWPRDPNHTVPTVSVNGQALAFDESWPSLDSPWLNIADYQFRLAIATDEDLVVDWTAEVPQIRLERAEPEPFWAEWPIQPDGTVDTGGFLGWIYPIGPFVWLYDLDRFVYIPAAHVGPAGAWLYVPRHP